MSTRKPTAPSDAVSIKLGDLSRVVGNLFDGGDASRAAAFTRSATIVAARANVIQRRRDVLALDATRNADAIAALDTELAGAHESAISFATDAAVATTPPATPRDGMAVTHGVVHGATKPVKVTLHDDTGAVIAHGVTAADGRFVLEHAAPRTDRIYELRIHDPRHGAPVPIDHRDARAFVVVRLRG